jgi:hypothetical protein
MPDCRCDMHGRGKACHCRRCCLTFSGPTAFDHHIKGGQHWAPSERGLAEVRPGVWGSPGDRVLGYAGATLNA